MSTLNFMYEKLLSESYHHMLFHFADIENIFLERNLFALYILSSRSSMQSEFLIFFAKLYSH